MFTKREMHFIQKEGQHWTFVYGLNFPDGTMWWPTTDLVVAYRDNREMLESFLIGTNIYFEPIINIALLFIARLCSSGNQGVEVIVTSFVLYLFLSSLLKNNFCAISCALLYQKGKKNQ